MSIRVAARGAQFLCDGGPEGSEAEGVTKNGEPEGSKAKGEICFIRHQ